MPMARLLITAGPTRAYLDDVRFLTNASSGRMAASLAVAAIGAGHEVTIVSGPVACRYPAAARVEGVTTTDEMLAAALEVLPRVDGVIAAAAPCDFQPAERVKGKIPRSGTRLTLHLEPTVDVVATLARRARRGQWVVAFALEVGADRDRAVAKAVAKRCDLIVCNGLPALESSRTRVDVYEPSGTHLGGRAGSKRAVARWLVALFDERFPSPRRR
ncbi:MAG: phosphopantothenoylcysteine decarboxylase [Planctomycetaceae bacterium]